MSDQPTQESTDRATWLLIEGSRKANVVELVAVDLDELKAERDKYKERWRGARRFHHLAADQRDELRDALQKIFRTRGRGYANFVGALDDADALLTASSKKGSD